MNNKLKNCILGLVAVIAIQAFSQSSEGSWLLGDVNGDGNVDVADVSAVISMMSGSTTYDNADVNGDGAVDVADISSVISIMAANARRQITQEP